MSLLICLPDSMEPKVLSSALLSLDSRLKIEIGPKKILNPNEVEFAVVWNHNQDCLLSNYPNLKAILSYGHGVDNLLSDKSLPPGIPIVRLTSKDMADLMNEYLLAVVLMFRRQFLEHAKNPKLFEWGVSTRLDGNKIGILGLGFLGRAAANYFLQTGFNVSGWSRTQKKMNGVKCFTGEDGLTQMLKNTDFLINLLPLTTETQYLLNYKILSKLKRGAYFINVGRGKTLVDKDLIRLLKVGHLSGACLDVFELEPLPEKHPFWKNKKILITPHNSSSTPPYSVAPQILANYKRAISGKQLLNLVNLELGY